MRILFVSSYYKPAYVYGGPARSVSALSEALARIGAEVTVYTTNANGLTDLDVPTDRSIELDEVHVNYFRRSSLLPRRYFYAPDLGRACHQHMQEFDLVYVCGTWTYPILPAARAALGSGVPYVISPRGSFMDWSMRQKWLKKRLYLNFVEGRYIDRASALHCTSALEAEQIKQWQFRAPAFLIQNAVDLAPFRTLPARGELRRSFGIPDDALISLFVGRLHAMKRIDRTVEIFAKVAEVIPDAYLLIVGADEDQSGAAAKAQVDQLGLSERVRFTGPLVGSELLQAYTDSDLLVLLSHRENFGMVVVEAMASGLPVLLSTGVGIGYEVCQHSAGCVVNVDSIQAEEKWRWLLESPEQRAKMSVAGMHLAYSEFSSESVAQQMLESFQQLIANRSVSVGMNG